MIRFVLPFVVALSFAHTASAQESESKMKLDDLKPKSEPVGEDADSIIHNNLLRAQSGSKSRWSLASTISYNGSTIQAPLAEERPNIAATTATTNEALLSGQISGKYNLNTQSSVMAGIGLRWFSPLRNNRKNTGTRYDMDNPYLTYQYLYSWKGVESVFMVQPTFYTNSNLRDHGYVMSVLVNQDNMYAMGDSGLSLGLSVWAQGGHFNKQGPNSAKPDSDSYLEDVRDDQADYLFGLAPILEFAFNDRYNFRTVTNLWNFEHLRNAPYGLYTADTITQSVGLGISVTRDIFLYPNVQFLPENIRADLTNVALNANINLF